MVSMFANLKCLISQCVLGSWAQWEQGETDAVWSVSEGSEGYRKCL